MARGLFSALASADDDDDDVDDYDNSLPMGSGLKSAVRDNELDSSESEGDVEEDEEEGEEEEEEVDHINAVAAAEEAEDDMDVQSVRRDRGVSICIKEREEAAEWEPILTFEALVKRGASLDLVDRCRRCCGSGAFRPTAIQAECWGMLIESVRDSSPSTAPVDIHALAREHGQDNVYIHVPVPDSDSECDDKGLGSSSPVVSSTGRAADVQTCKSCRVRDDLDLIGIAPTGSGKTLAFMVPLLVDDLCQHKVEIVQMTDVFGRFKDLFPKSFPVDASGASPILKRFEQLLEAGKTKQLLDALLQVTGKGEASPDKDIAASWKSLRESCPSVGLLAPKAAVLLPTRELAVQVANVASAIGASSAVIIGGVDPEAQRERLLLQAPALIVATPGRLRVLCGERPSSYFKRRGLATGTVNLSRGSAARGGGYTKDVEPDDEVLSASVSLGALVRLVMDEGDRLLDEGFTEDVSALARLASRRRQSMLFSATWSSETEVLASVLRPAVAHISVAGIPRTIVQDVEVIPRNARGKRLRELLQEFGHGKKVLIFVLYKKEAKELARMLVSEGFQAVALQGDMSQPARTKALQRFRTGEATVLVATDVAARGLDIGGVNHVVNFSLGLSMDSYVHRIGRCGRAGRHGTAITFITDGDERHAGPLQRLLLQCGQLVPVGLKEMGASYERHADKGTRLQVKHSGAGGEVKFVTKS